MASARYSWASSPTAEALIRSGRSLETSVTRWPSLARLRATARIRVSLSPSRKPDGSDCGVGVVELDPERAALRADGDGLVEAPVDDAQVVERAQRRAGEVAELGVVRLPSSSVITTTGSTTSCSAKRLSAPGSASRTLVSRTYVRRVLLSGRSCERSWVRSLLATTNPLLRVGARTPRPARCHSTDRRAPI